MSFTEILSATVTLAFAILAGWFKTREIYQKYLAGIRKQAIACINRVEAEYADTTKQGGKKFSLVVEAIYSTIPDWLKMIISKDMVERIVQSTFDGMEQFANEQLDQMAKKTLDQLDNLLKEG